MRKSEETLLGATQPILVSASGTGWRRRWMPYDPAAVLPWATPSQGGMGPPRPCRLHGEPYLWVPFLDTPTPGMGSRPVSTPFWA